ncbi:MAG: asparagine synthase (glutamine-hydrolyzing) [Deltaproteobacteria bacterium]|nr:asparagine synthase (glutamine-hydrolyzing) [Deltaproteobacteria bacterium]
MCGIAGTVNPAGIPRPDELTKNLWSALRRRGPDGRGYCALGDGVLSTGFGEQLPEGSPTALLTHTRLSIIDLSDAALQPMLSEDGRFAIVFNGEIYNYRELRDELSRAGYSFKTASDTEVLLNSYRHWGKEALNRLVGMFAFALLDAKKETLFLARDPFGIKPLYYTLTGGNFSFASTLRAIFTFPGVARRINPLRLFLYLRFGITDYGAASLIQDVSQLPPAHYLEVSLKDPGDVAPCRYWEAAGEKENVNISFNEAALKLREMMLKSVELHLRSDAPVGFALSGGIDSSALLCAAREVCDSERSLTAFSYVPANSAISEERWIDMLAKHARAAVHKVTPTAEDLLGDLDELIEEQGEPFASTTMYAQFRVQKLAAQHGVKVMIEGQGADEILAGYPQYRAARLASLFRQRRWRDAVRFTLGCSRYPEGAFQEVILKSLQYILPQGLQEIAHIAAGKPIIPRWLNGEWFRARGAVYLPRGRLEGKDVLIADLKRTLNELCIPHLLRHGDRNSMAFSIESRVPYLIPEIVKFAYGLPEHFLISPRGETKHLLRAAMRGIVPDAVLDRKDKVGFDTPETEWLRTLGPHIESILKSRTAKGIEAFSSERVLHHWEMINRGKRSADNYVWRCVNLVKWAELSGIDLNEPARWSQDAPQQKPQASAALLESGAHPPDSNARWAGNLSLGLPNMA